MILKIHPHRARTIRLSCAAVIIAAGSIVLTGWALGIEQMRNGLIGSQPVRPVTVIALICGALALMFEEKRWLSRMLSAVTLILGVIGTAQWALDSHAGFLRWFEMAGLDMRMPLRVAAAAMFVGATGLSRERRVLAQTFAAGAGFIALLSIVAFAYGGTLLPARDPVEISLASAVLLLVWTFAVLVARSQQIVVDGVALVSLLTPIAFGAVCLRAARPPYFDLPFALALLATATGFGLLFTARTLRARIRKSERLYRTIVQTSQEGICITDTDGRFTFVNDQLAEMLGHPARELIGQFARSFVAPEENAAAPERDELRKGGATVTQADVRWLRRDGSTVLLLTSTTTLHHRDGSRAGLLTMLTDLTARTLAEASRHESEQRFRAIYEADMVGVGYFSFDGHALEANNELLKIYGVDREELVDGRWTASMRPDADEEHRTALAELEATGRCRPFEKEAVRMDGTSFWALLAIARVGDGASNVVLAIDITERVEARRAVERTLEILSARLDALEGAGMAQGDDDASRQRSQIENLASRLAALHDELESFSYSVSHDLRAPLRAIDGFSRELLLDYNDDLDARGRDYLARIRAAAERMARLIDDLLDLSRVARTGIRRERVDVSALAGEILAEVPAVEMHITPGLTAFADPRLVRIALDNLIGNAVKFSSRRASPCIDVFGPAEGSFAVRDNGDGFDLRHAEKIFQPFERLHSSTYEGTGLGLAIVHRIVTRHGGSIRADSEPGHGSTFTFTLGDQPL